jgi:SynChlorMet cassette protein ScmD
MAPGDTTSDTVILKKDQVVIREEFDDWALLFDPDTGNVCGVNPVGVQIWKMIDGKRTIRDISRIIAEKYPDASGSVDEDVRSFVDAISEKGYVTIS